MLAHRTRSPDLGMVQGRPCFSLSQLLRPWWSSSFSRIISFMAIVANSNLGKVGLGLHLMGENT